MLRVKPRRLFGTGLVSRPKFSGSRGTRTERLVEAWGNPVPGPSHVGFEG